MVVKGPNNSQIMIIAHRGGRYWKGRNKNFNYISEALYHGADIIELDIRLKDGEYIVQHTKATPSQGLLINALTKIKNTPIYLDIKDSSIDPNHWISFVKKHTKQLLIIGSFYSSQLKKIKKKKNIIISYHVYSPLYDLKLAKRIKADWVVLWNYNIAKWKIKELNNQGLRVAMAGNLINKQQFRYIKQGTCAVFVYDVKKFRKKLSRENIKTKSKSSKYLINLLSKVFILNPYLKSIKKSIPKQKNIVPVLDIKQKNPQISPIPPVKINFKLK